MNKSNGFEIFVICFILLMFVIGFSGSCLTESSYIEALDRTCTEGCRASERPEDCYFTCMNR